MNTEIRDILKQFINAEQENEIMNCILNFFHKKSDLFVQKKNARTIDHAKYDNRFSSLVYELGHINLSEYEHIPLYLIQTNELSERSSKKHQFNLAKDILRTDISYIAGIFIFFDKCKNKRVSYVEKIYQDGKTRYNNFRRYTFFVSTDQTNKTFIQQFSEGDFNTQEEIKKVFSVEKVTKQFYQEVANWYFWALNHVRFPKDAENQPNGREIALIRFITRIIFIWFMREKGLVPKKLFDRKELATILKSLDDNESSYYRAILQNLFFATLNTPIDKRQFRGENIREGLNPDYMNHSYFRHHNDFKDPDSMQELFGNIPFLNGGLFECLDKSKNDPDNDTGKEIRIDGFSDVKEKQPLFPNFLFFSDEITVDLSSAYQDKKYSKARTRGIINILSSYNFTIDENTLKDEEIALDPELLGNIFENLLAAYIPETSTTARRATGSYYTPKPIVDYMVSTSLKEYFITRFKEEWASGNEEVKSQLEQLFSDESDENPFDENITNFLIQKIHQIKIIDPAVGSGAFPMGILHKLVFLLSKLDPHNKKWKEKQIAALNHITDPKLKQTLIQKIEENFQHNELDYGRKLYLIQNCIYGVDIQPIAIQIAKLRFFISLLVDEKSNNNKEENFGIEPLPNLETKLVTANTLIGINANSQNSFKSQEIENLENELFLVRQEYFTASDVKRKKDLEEKDREIRMKIKELLSNNFHTEFSKKVAEWNPYNSNLSADWFDPEWMFGVKDGFDIVIGNPPYISTKGVDKKFKEELEEQFGFADDTYNHFYFKGIELLKNGGVLTYISSKTFWTIQTKKNLRQLILKNKLLQLFDTANPFESAMVDTCVTLIQKTNNKNENYEFIYLDGKKSLNEPTQAKANIEVYQFAPNQVFFPITDYNLKIFHKYGKKVNELLNTWWDKISTSKNIDKYKSELEQYRRNLKPGDITLLGLVTEGGVGIQTGNNGKYVGVLEGTKWADNVCKQRPEKLLLASHFCKKEGIKTKSDAESFLKSMSENEIRELFDSLKEKYGRDIFGQGWLYRVVCPDEVADVEKLTEDEKLNGIKGKRTFVPYDKGDKDGNRWWAPTPYYIDWSRDNVKILQTDAKARWQGYQFYFREGFCWNNVLSDEKIKCRIKEKSVHSTEAMTFISLEEIKLPNYYLVCMLNSTFYGNYRILFINTSHHLTTGDAKEFPIIVPTISQLKFFDNVFGQAVAVQKEKFAGKISENDAEKKLKSIQEKLDRYVKGMYM